MPSADRWKIGPAANNAAGNDLSEGGRAANAPTPRAQNVQLRAVRQEASL